MANNTVTFKDLYNDVRTTIPKVGAFDTYSAINKAIDRLNSHGFLQESNPWIPVDTEGMGNLTLLTRQIVIVDSVLDYYQIKLTPTDTDGVVNFTSAGEKFYTNVGNKVYVKPSIDTQTLVVSIAIGGLVGTITRTSGSFVSDGYEDDMWIYLGTLSSSYGYGKITNVAALVLTVSDVYGALVETTPPDKVSMAISQSYQIIGYETLEKFAAYSNSIATAEITLKETFRSVLINIALMTLFANSRYKDVQEIANYKTLVDEGLQVLAVNEANYKEINKKVL